MCTKEAGAALQHPLQWTGCCHRAERALGPNSAEETTALDWSPTKAFARKLPALRFHDNRGTRLESF